jgi:hypothetical protein
MNGVEIDCTAGAANDIFADISKSHLDFTRAMVTVVREGRSHPEARCNRCGFRITSADSNDFDREEQEHASLCSGSPVD